MTVCLRNKSVNKQCLPAISSCSFAIRWFQLMLTILVVSAFLINQTHGFKPSNGEGRKLFGGYRITPKQCRATKTLPSADPRAKGPTICMFNHECAQRNGEVVGACMDGFLFGACCQVPNNQMPENTLINDAQNSYFHQYQNQKLQQQESETNKILSQAYETFAENSAQQQNLENSPAPDSGYGGVDGLDSHKQEMSEKIKPIASSTVATIVKAVSSTRLEPNSISHASTTAQTNRPHEPPQIIVNKDSVMISSPSQSPQNDDFVMQVLNTLPPGEANQIITFTTEIPTKIANNLNEQSSSESNSFEEEPTAATTKPLIKKPESAQHTGNVQQQHTHSAQQQETQLVQHEYIDSEENHHTESALQQQSDHHTDSIQHDTDELFGGVSFTHSDITHPGADSDLIEDDLQFSTGYGPQPVFLPAPSKPNEAYGQDTNKHTSNAYDATTSSSSITTHVDSIETIIQQLNSNDNNPGPSYSVINHHEQQQQQHQPSSTYNNDKLEFVTKRPTPYEEEEHTKHTDLGSLSYNEIDHNDEQNAASSYGETSSSITLPSSSSSSPASESTTNNAAYGDELILEDHTMPEANYNDFQASKKPTSNFNKMPAIGIAYPVDMSYMEEEGNLDVDQHVEQQHNSQQQQDTEVSYLDNKHQQEQSVQETYGNTLQHHKHQQQQENDQTSYLDNKHQQQQNVQETYGNTQQHHNNQPQQESIQTSYLDNKHQQQQNVQETYGNTQQHHNHQPQQENIQTSYLDNKHQQQQTVQEAYGNTQQHHKHQQQQENIQTSYLDNKHQQQQTVHDTYVNTQQNQKQQQQQENVQTSYLDDNHQQQQNVQETYGNTQQHHNYQPQQENIQTSYLDNKHQQQQTVQEAYGNTQQHHKHQPQQENIQTSYLDNKHQQQQNVQETYGNTQHHHNHQPQQENIQTSYLDNKHQQQQTVQEAYGNTQQHHKPQQQQENIQTSYLDNKHQQQQNAQHHKHQQQQENAQTSYTDNKHQQQQNVQDTYVNTQQQEPENAQTSYLDNYSTQSDEDHFSQAQTVQNYVGETHQRPIGSSIGVVTSQSYKPQPLPNEVVVSSHTTKVEEDTEVSTEYKPIITTNQIITTAYKTTTKPVKHTSSSTVYTKRPTLVTKKPNSKKPTKASNQRPATYSYATTNIISTQQYYPTTPLETKTPAPAEPLYSKPTASYNQGIQQDYIISSGSTPKPIVTRKPTKKQNAKPASTSYITGPTTPRPVATPQFQYNQETSVMQADDKLDSFVLSTAENLSLASPTQESLPYDPPVFIGSQNQRPQYNAHKKPGFVKVQPTQRPPAPTVLITPKPTTTQTTASTFTAAQHTTGALSDYDSTSFVYNSLVTRKPADFVENSAGDYMGISTVNSNDFDDPGYYGAVDHSKPSRPLYVSGSTDGIYPVPTDDKPAFPGYYGPTPTYPAFQVPGENLESPIDEQIYNSPNDFINFPPVRNPNLNMSATSSSVTNDLDLSTPAFVEDTILKNKMNTLVHKIVESLQGNFEALADMIDDNNNTAAIQTYQASALDSTAAGASKKPTRKPVTKVTTAKPKVTTKKPITRVSTRTPTKKPVTTRRPESTTKRNVVARRTTTTTKRPASRKPSRKPTTTTQVPIEDDLVDEEDEEDVNPSDNEIVEEESYGGSGRKIQCGMRPNIKSGRIVGGKDATFGAYPWQVLVRESTWLGLFTKNKCGGVLITNRYVITAAHCQPGFLASLVAVMGEFDISGDVESKRAVTKNVKRVIVHRQYDPATFENDIALLELDSPVTYDTHIVPICMPSDGADFTGRMATATGWGRLKYGGGVPSVLQEVQVPVIENSVCQEMFLAAKHKKIILNSFLCAGYANGQKDSCEGDSGGPLVLQRSDGRYELAGTVSHGIKCAAPYLPGVYMRTTFYKPWLRSITGVK